MKTKSLLLIAAGSGGLFTAANPAFAQNWTLTSAPLTNWTAVASSADGTRLVAAANGTFPGNIGSIYISTNSGATWVGTSAPITDWACVASSADGTKLLASGAGGTFTSTDSGATWAWRTNVSFRSIASSADGSSLVGTPDGDVYTSTNSGATWAEGTNYGYCVASSADGTKLVTAYFYSEVFLMGGIFVSTNAGLTWTGSSAPLDYSTGWSSLASSVDGSKLAATIGYTDFPTGPGPIFTSPDGGDAWHASSSPRLHWVSIACSADGTELVAAAREPLPGNIGPIYLSTNSGAAWAESSAPSNAWYSVASSADGNKLVAVVNGGGIYTWQATPTPRLNITLSDGNLVISWTVPSMDFVLQQNSDLTTTNWMDVTNTRVLNLTNLQNQVSIPIGSNTERFYRLRH